MKKSLLIALFCVVSTLAGQTQGIKIQLQEADGLITENIRALFKKALLWKYSLNISSTVPSGQLIIQYPNRLLTFPVEVNNKLLAEDFRISVDGVPSVSSLPLRHYNTTASNRLLRCRISVADHFILGSFWVDGQEYIIEQASNYDPSYASDKIIVYNTKDINSPNYICKVNDELTSHRSAESVPEVAEATSGICRTIDYAIAVDHKVFQKRTSIVQTANYILSIMNLVEGNYLGVFNDDLNFKITELLIFTSPQNNPWASTTNISSNLSSLRLGLSMFTRPFDLASYWMTETDSNAVGLAYVGTTCSLQGFNTNVISDYPGSNPGLLRCVVAHEIGHNFGCSHTGSGFIMAPTVSTSNTWAPESITVFNNRLANNSQSGCITACQFTACEKLDVSNIRITDNGSQFTLNWDSNPNRVRVEYRKFNSGAYTLLGNYNSGVTSTLLPHLTPCGSSESFQIKLTAICPNNLEGVSTIIAMQSTGTTAVANVNITASETRICTGKNVSFTATSNLLSPAYQWRLNGVIVGSNAAQFNSSTLRNGDQISCRVTGLSCNNSTTGASNIISMAVFSPPAPVIIRENNQLIVKEKVNGNTYQWSLNNILLPGENNINLAISNFGSYIVTEKSGPCSSTSNVFTVFPFSDDRIAIYPNPVNNVIFAQTPTADEFITAARIYDVTGKLIASKQGTSQNIIRFEVQSLMQSIYVIEVITNKRNFKMKFMKG